MCYTGKCKYEDHTGGCWLRGNDFPEDAGYSLAGKEIDKTEKYDCNVCGGTGFCYVLGKDSKGNNKRIGVMEFAIGLFIGVLITVLFFKFGMGII